ncbi:MAG: PhzF family phenazine biosynthesis protein [Silanimonas sp.]
MTTHDFLQLDVFAAAPGRGNPLGVVFGADELDTATMQAIAAWLNLSESTFVLRATQPGADYRLRIFTPRQELPFAGHPSVGTAHAVLERGMVTPKAQGDGATGLVQECAAGLLPLRITGEGPERVIHVRAPRGVERIADATPVLASLQAARLGAVRAALVDNGPRWWCIELTDEATVRSLAPDLEAMAAANRSDGSVGVAVYARCPSSATALGASTLDATDYALVVRAFVPADGIPEDPVTGSANAAIAAWLHANAALPAPHFRASQGREVGRDGFVEIEVDAEGEVWIGGLTQTVIDGTFAW